MAHLAGGILHAVEVVVVVGHASLRVPFVQSEAPANIRFAHLPVSSTTFEVVRRRHIPDHSTWQGLPDHFEGSNIANDPGFYTIENKSADPERTVETSMSRITPWDGNVIHDLRVGTGFHASRFATTAARVVAVEPGAHLRLRLMQRLIDQQLSNISVVGASATDRILTSRHRLDIDYNLLLIHRLY